MRIGAVIATKPQNLTLGLEIERICLVAHSSHILVAEAD